jgi:hypothetical protein
MYVTRPDGKSEWVQPTQSVDTAGNIATIATNDPTKPVAVRLSDGTTWYNASGGSGGSGLTDAQLRATPVPVSGTVAVSNLPATQPVSGSVSVANFPATQPVSGPLTDAQIRATPVPVSGSVSISNLPATQPVSGSVSVANFPATQPVSGPLTDTQLRAVAVPVSGSVSVSNFPASQAVTGTFWQTTQPISGAVSVSNFPATQPVSGTFFQSTQPVSAASLPLPSGAAQEHATAISPHAVRLTDGAAFFKPTTPSDTQPISGTVTANIGSSGSLALDATLTGGAQKTKLVDSAGVNVATIRPGGSAAQAGDASLIVALSPNSPVVISQPSAASLNATVTGNVVATQGGGSWLVNPGNVANTVAWLTTLAAQASASSSPTGVVSLGNSLGKTNVLKTGALASSATTANQVVLTYTVTSGKTFYLEYFDFVARLTTYATTATLFGSISLRIGGTAVYTTDIFHAGAMQPIQITLSEPIAVASGTVIDVVCTPSASTAFSWKANFGGYEK